VGSDSTQVTHQRLWGLVSISRPPINAIELARSCLLAVIIPSLLTRELFTDPACCSIFPAVAITSRRGPEPAPVWATMCGSSLHSMLELQMPRYFIQVGECAHRTTHAAQWPIA
jgi:hypothetical protein